MSDTSRQCYICLDDEGADEEWVSPCRCAGSLKWVHQHCLIRWVRDQEATYPWSSVACPQCTATFRLLPGKGVLVTVLEDVATVVYPSCLFATLCFCAVVAYNAVCTSIGNYALSQLYGSDATRAIISSYGYLQSGALLHLTTYLLLGVNWISEYWERSLLEVLRSLPRLPVIGCLLPEGVPEGARFRLPGLVARVIINSVLLPYLAREVGEACFSYIDSKLYRGLLGGLTCLAVKAVLSIYVMQKLELRRKRMILLPYMFCQF